MIKTLKVKIERYTTEIPIAQNRHNGEGNHYCYNCYVLFLQFDYLATDLRGRTVIDTQAINVFRRKNIHLVVNAVMISYDQSTKFTGKLWVNQYRASKRNSDPGTKARLQDGPG